MLKPDPDPDCDGLCPEHTDFGPDPITVRYHLTIDTDTDAHPSVAELDALADRFDAGWV